MPYYRQVGTVPRKRHTLARRDGGGYLAEELMGEEGFSQESALLYHLHSPSAVVAIEALDDPSTTSVSPDRPLVPRHVRTGELVAGGDPVCGRQRLLANDDVALAFVAADRSSDLYRNASGDELAYVHSGEATVETSFGALDVGEGDYVVLPTGTTHRWVLRSPTLQLLVVESSSHVRIPPKYLSERGQLVEGAPFSERDLRGPTDPLVVDGETDVTVLVRNRAGLSRHVHARHPFDVVGWDGCLYPFALSIRDFEPIVGLLHQPPPVHQTFAGQGFVVCSFVPRPFDFHPQAVKIPYHHANVDSDEVLFYAGGDFMSRAGSGIGVGSISYHPAGFVHGPQPGSLERSMDASATGETAVMVDTFRPLAVSEAARAVSDASYPTSWLEK
jgi:homogentisate 1,2-dioxygenase